MSVVNIADLVDPKDPQGRTYRQINAAKSHAIPIGTLVEIADDGTRAYVVYHGRDCDQTPLYYLSLDERDTEKRNPGRRNGSWYGGVAEHYIKAVQPAPKKSDLTFPTIHMNGTSAERLIEALSDASDALDVAYVALKAAAPNGRDYYPQGDKAFESAVAQHMARLQRIDDVKREIDETIIAIGEAKP